MKNQLFKFTFIILILSFSVYSQNTNEVKLIDELGKPCSEDLSARYDSFLTELQNTPNSKGYIIFNGEISQEGTNLRFIEILKRHLEFRKFDENRIVLIRGENLKDMNIQFWLMPNDSNPPKVEKLYSNEKITSPKMFQRIVAEFNKNYGNENEFFDSFSGNWGCDFAPNLKDYAEVLKSYNNLTGYIIIYGSKTQSKKRIKNFAVKQLITKYKIAKNRLRTVYGENREESEIELWFVPKGDIDPKPSN